MDEKYVKRNLRLYSIFRIFTKRAFLPVAGIYMAEYAGLELSQLAIIAVAASVVGLVAQLPTGYFADRVSRVISLRIGSIILVAGSLLYILFPGFAGILIAVLMLELGYAFFGGAIQVLIHDTLHVTNRESEYTKVTSMAQSYGLFGNFLIVTSAGFTYTIDPRLPFVLAVVSYGVLCTIVFLMKDPMLVHEKKVSKKDFRVLLTPAIGLFILFIGLISALQSGPSHFYSIAQREAGLSVPLISFVAGAASLLSAAFGFFNHKLQKLPTPVFALIDTAVIAFNYISFATKNVYIIVFAVIVSLYFFRYRMIVYEHKILDRLKDNSLKATILSGVGSIGQLNEIWVPLALSGLAAGSAILIGFQRLGIIAACVMLPLAIVSSLLWIRNEHK